MTNLLKSILSNTWACVTLLAIVALCATALVWHGDVSVAQLKAFLLALAMGAGIGWPSKLPAPEPEK